MNLLFIPLTIGLPAIDESLEKLLTAMETFPNVAVLGDAVSMAKALGLAFPCVFHPLHGFARLCRFRERVWSPLHGLWPRQRTRK